MHETRSTNDLAAVRFRDALMTQTHTQDWNFAAETENNVLADTCFARRARPRRNADVARRQGGDLLDRDLVVTLDQQFAAELAEILGQVVSEGVVIIEKQQHRSSNYRV